jgi:hypothetical protein
MLTARYAMIDHWITLNGRQRAYLRALYENDQRH